MHRTRPGELTCLALITAAVAGLWCPATARSSSSYGIGIDYSSQSYQTGYYDTLNWEWQEQDTLDRETEARSFWDFSLGLAAPNRTFDLANNLGLSTGSVRDRLGLDFKQNLFSPLALRLATDLEARYYHRLLPRLADTGYTKSHLNNTTKLALELTPSSATELAVSGGLEIQRYAEPDSFSYNYLTNQLQARARQEIGTWTTLDAEYTRRRRNVAAVQARNYTEHAGRAGLDQYFDNGLHLAFDNGLTRRRYPGLEHSYWEETPTITLAKDFSAVRLELGWDSRFTWYDSATAVYQDFAENTLKLCARRQLGPELSFEIVPQLALGSGLAAPSDQDYQELSAAFTIDFFRLDRLWLSFEDRPGKRTYLNPDSAYQSAYWFNELNLTLNWTILTTASSALQLNGMASITPEWHLERTDNTSLGIYSLELRYRPR